MMKLEKPVFVLWCASMCLCASIIPLLSQAQVSSLTASPTACADFESDFKVDFDVCNPFNVLFNNLTVTGKVVSWSFGDGSMDTALENSSHIYNKEGVYKVSMITKNKYGCLDTTYKKFLLNIDSGTIFNNRHVFACRDQPLQLTGDATAFKNCWLPPTYLSATNIYNPKCTPLDEIWYDHINFKYKSNVIKNPNFNGGNAQFTSDYMYDSFNNTSGHYFVGPLPKLWNNDYQNCYTEIDTFFLGDTMMIINGSTNPGAVVWKETVTVIPNTNYVFTFAGRSLTQTDSIELVYSINAGEILGSKVLPRTECGRSRVNTTWYSDKNTSVTIKITNKNIQTDRNNFALDSFSLKPIYINYDSILVSIKPDPVFTIQKDTPYVCMGDSVKLTATGGDKYQWIPAQGVANPTAAVTSAQLKENTVFQVIITENSCGIKDTLNTSVTVKALPTMLLRKSNDVNCDVAYTNLVATGGISYSWQPQQLLSDARIYNPIAKPKETTTFTCVAAGGNGCVSRDSIKVTVKNEGKLPFLMPTAFTPNGDGLNDCFGVQQRGILNDMQLSVYNRFGGRIFYTTTPDKCWDGKYNGVLQDVGTYIYILTLSGACGKETHKGTLVLIK